MTAFKQILEARSRQALRTVTLRRSDFADAWPAKPNEDLVLGLRKMCDGDVQTARAEAAKFAIEMHEPSDSDGRVEAFNDALMRWLIIASTCDPNDVGVTASVFEGSEENVRFALTPQAIRYLWDHIDAFHIETNPAVPEISDEDIILLAARLINEPFPEMDKSTSVRLRKLLSMIQHELEDLETEADVVTSG